MELLVGLNQKEKDDFKRICNRLLGTCFICKASRTGRTDYYFVLKYKEKFAEYLGVLGYRLEINEEYGVIQLTNPENYNHLNLRLIESVLILILRILYDEKKRELSVSDEVIVNLGDIQDRYLSLRLKDKMIDKTTMRNSMRLFQRLQLIQVLDRDLADEESRILIYNSIAMAVRIDDIRQAYDKIEIYRKGRIRDEDADQDEAGELAQI